MGKNLESINHSLFYFQERDMENVTEMMKTTKRTLFTANTGYGKTYSFCTVAKWFNHNYKEKVLILCHREELVEQAQATCMALGMTVEKILPTTKRMHHNADVYIAMEMSLFNRVSKNKRFLINVGLVIIDECHSQLFNKHLDLFPNAKVLGFTATPVLNERITYFKCGYCKTCYDEVGECCGIETMEWSRPKTMSQFYDDIVVGADIPELIEFGQIVKDVNFIEKYADLDDLKVDATGDFSQSSQTKAFGSDNAVFNVLLNYERLCLGKKTIIFNSSSKINKLVYDRFKEKGYNCRIYDSVNDKEESRKATVKWFNDNDDAILINVNVFTTGFDSKEVQAIILNRATTSLSLFLQMVGRGARSTKKIFKDKFIVVDGGGNIDRFNTWSSARDWRKIFFEGIGKDSAKKETPLSVSECEECGFLFARSESTCPECGWTTPIKVKKENVEGESVLQPLENIPYPNGKKIGAYAVSRGEDIHFAFKVMYEQILDLFKFHGITKANYESNLGDGRLDKRLGEIVRPVYFELIGKEEFKSDTNRTLKYVLNKCKEKIMKYYNS